MHIINLPFEIIELIIGNSTHDKVELQFNLKWSPGLLAPLARTSERCRLFDPHCKALCERLAATIASSPEIATFVRELWIVGVPFFEDPTLPQVLNQLCNISTLHLGFGQLWPSWQQIGGSIWNQTALPEIQNALVNILKSSSLHHLSIYQLDSIPTHIGKLMLSILDVALGTVSFDVDAHWQKEELSKEELDSAKLRSLKITGSGNLEPFISLMPSSKATLKKFKFQHSDNNTVELTHRVIAKHRDSLEELHVYDYYSLHTKDAASKLDIGDFPQLHTVAIVTIDIDSMVNYIVPTLSTVSQRNQIKNLIFDVLVPGVSNGARNMAKLDKLLQEKRFDHLKSVIWVATILDDCNHIKAILPETFRRGILQTYLRGQNRERTIE